MMARFISSKNCPNRGSRTILHGRRTCIHKAANTHNIILNHNGQPSAKPCRTAIPGIAQSDTRKAMVTSMMPSSLSLPINYEMASMLNWLQ